MLTPLLLSIAETGKGHGRCQAASFLWKVTARVCGMELLSLDNKTTNMGINNYQKASGQILNHCLQYLVNLLTESGKTTWENKGFLLTFSVTFHLILVNLNVSWLFDFEILLLFCHLFHDILCLVALWKMWGDLSFYFVKF